MVIFKSESRKGLGDGEDPSAASFKKSVFVIPCWPKKEGVTHETAKL